MLAAQLRLLSTAGHEGLFVSCARVLQVLTYPVTFHKPPSAPHYPSAGHQYNLVIASQLHCHSALSPQCLSNVGITEGVRVFPSTRMSPQI